MQKIKIPEHMFDYSEDAHNIQSATVKNVTMYIDDDEGLLEKLTGRIVVELKDGNVYKGKLIVGDEPGSVSIEMSGGMPVEDEEVLVEILQEDLMEASFEYEGSSLDSSTRLTSSDDFEGEEELTPVNIPSKVVNFPKNEPHNISKLEFKNVKMQLSGVGSGEEMVEKISGTIIATLKNGKSYTGRLRSGEEWGSIDFRMKGMPVDDEEVLFELVNDALLTKESDLEASTRITAAISLNSNIKIDVDLTNFDPEGETGNTVDENFEMITDAAPEYRVRIRNIMANTEEGSYSFEASGKAKDLFRWWKDWFKICGSDIVFEDLNDFDQFKEFFFLDEDENLDAGVKPSDMNRLLSQVILSSRKRKLKRML